MRCAGNFFNKPAPVNRPTRKSTKPSEARFDAPLSLKASTPLLLVSNQPDSQSCRNKGASNLASLGFVCFLIGRFSGSAILRKFSAHKILGIYAVANVFATFLVFLKLGWFSVICVFLSYFFMSIMFPTIFALGIFGLGARAKKASAFIVMAIMGGALLPKLMGYVADKFDMSRGFIVPMFCFAFVAYYGFKWPALSKAESLHAVPAKH